VLLRWTYLEIWMVEHAFRSREGKALGTSETDLDTGSEFRYKEK
jgi:hypothetical protein